MTTPDYDFDAAEYVLGTMTDEERQAFERLRDGDPALQAATAAWESSLGEALVTMAPAAPPARLWERIDHAVDALPDPRTIQVGRAEGCWTEFLPGVQLKLLRPEDDSGTATFLMKLAPGASVPAHNHPKTEECYVIDGVMQIGAAHFYPGDYIAYPAGVPHTQMGSSTGGTLLIRGGYH
ncbi:MAG TPA: hypothetical protein DCL54_03585 [Alphaproteobacteria bacterium]|nr:hypothetical protein [Alphaproteobacteria bacterium]HAJ45647.1 hypothetical protein [Alphaproteobacteria bacterium]